MSGDARSHPRAPAIYRRALGGAILAAGFVLAGCAGGGTTAGSPSATVPPPVAPSPTVAPAPTAVPWASASASSSTTACVSVNRDYWPDARGEAGDPVDLARTGVEGLRPGDVVERGDPVEGGTAVRIVRAGQIVGDVTYVSDGHGRWLLSGGMLCDGLGFKS